MNAGLAITPTLDVLADAESAPLFFLIEVSKEFQARHARTMSIQEFLGLEDIHSALPHDLSLSYDEDGRPHLGNDGYAFLNPDAVHTIWAFFNTALSLVRDMPFDPPLSRLKSPTSNATEYVMELFNDKVAVRMLVDEENLTDLAKAGRKIVDDSTPDGSCDGSIWTREDCSGPSSALKATSSSWNESEFTEWRNHVVFARLPTRLHGPRRRHDWDFRTMLDAQTQISKKAKTRNKSHSSSGTKQQLFCW